MALCLVNVPHTTAENAPFGIVQLADATDEGWGCNIRQMHWAETGNCSVVPNPAFPNAFVAAARVILVNRDMVAEVHHIGAVPAPTSPAIQPVGWCRLEVDPATKFPWLIDRHFPCVTGAQTTPQLMGGVVLLHCIQIANSQTLNPVSM